VEAYEKLGLVEPKIISAMIRAGEAPVPPEVLARRYGEKTVWEQLDDKAKTRYILVVASAEHLYRTLADYGDVFADVRDMALKMLVERDWSLATSYLAEREPHLISAGGRLELYEAGGGFAGVKVGDFVAQVADMEEPKPEAMKKFIVYHLKDKVGVPVSARTAEEAVAKAEEAYPKFLEELAKLKLLADQRELELWSVKEKGGFRLYVAKVERPFKEFLVRPGVLKEIEEHRKAAEAAEARKREAASASA